MKADTPATTEPSAREQGRFAYMLMTHKEPQHVEDLAERLLELSPHAEIVVHHDLACDALPWDGRPPCRVHLIDRSYVLWGDWSIVETTLRMIRYALDQLNADWFVVLSGEHRPVVDLTDWEHTTLCSGTDAFVEAVLLPDHLRFGRSDEDANRFLARCTHRWVTVRQPRASAVHRAVGGLWKLSRYIQPCAAVEYSHRRRTWFIGTPRRRGILRSWSFYKGSQWIAFNQRSAKAILGVDPAVTEWFKRGHIPDETYFQSVLRREPGLVVSDQVVTYVPPGPERPTATRWMVLDVDDLPTVWRSGAAFARKVDPDTRPEVLRAIDAEVDRQRSQRSIRATADPRSSQP
jgi:hypothetical protein